MLQRNVEGEFFHDAVVLNAPFALECKTPFLGC